MKKKLKKIKKNGGAAMLISVIFFLFISLAIISGLVSPTVREFKISADSIRSKQSYFLSESGVEDAYYRLKNSALFAIGNSTSINLNNNIATTNITDSGYNQKTITSVGDVSLRQRINSLVLSAGAGVGFNYGIQTGNGGFEISGGGTVYGNIYANGPIIASGYPTIHGSAISAGEYEIVPLVSHGSSFPPPYSLDFGYQNTSPQDMSQSFTVPTSDPIKRARLYIKRSTSGWMNDINVRITTDNSNKPSKTTLTLVVLPYGDVPTSFGYVTVTFPGSVTLTPGTKYWIVLDTSATWSARYSAGASLSTYENGLAKKGTYSTSNGGTWADSSPVGLDMYFDFFPEGDSGFITGAIISGDASAYEITNSTVSGELNCQIGSSNNKYCDTSHGVPPPLPMPFSDANIQDWKDTGTAGGIIANPPGYTSSNCTVQKHCPCPGNSASDNTAGNCIVDWRNATFGPGKIVGNLVVKDGNVNNGTGILTLTGTVYVAGTVTVNGGGMIKLPANFSEYSATLISDGVVLLSGGSYTGSGVLGSYLFVVTTSTSSSAITVSGGSGAIAVCAQNGTVALSGGISINAATGKRITMRGGATVTYQDGLASPSFQSGPSGGWAVSSWGETE
ncbi:MAG: choice-of-anchor R domain-containing protein [Candidatus Paceibacterota bacterium]|jgi:hypothetical protein